MKIGILTLPLHTNYGGIIQAYALQKTLIKLGYEEVYLINKEVHKLPILKIFSINIKRLIKKILLINTEPIFYEKKERKEYLLVRTQIQQFIDSEFTNIINIDDYRKVPEIFDTIIVGSDQIWNNRYVSSIEFAYLKFAINWKIKRISYAASFGTAKLSYNEKQKNNCKKLIQRFDFISVREKSGVNICKNTFDMAASHVLDPTLLLSQTDYSSIIDICNKEEKNINGDLFAYVLNYNEKIESIIGKICDKLNFTPYYASTDRNNVGIEKRKTVKMCSWLNYFRNAKMIIADSYHACIFSIIFKKQFFVILNNEENERINSLLNMFNLKNRIIDNIQLIDDKVLHSKIEWGKLDNILQQEKKKSLLFLQNSLTN